jgi:EAL domain-containing protein (putative c-di-GMP-specific phosphodiesterase class I)
MVALEALSRWDDRRLGSVEPAEFVRVAEDSGLIHQLGSWALEQACKAVADASSTLDVSVNVSARQLADPGLVGIVDRALQRSGLAPQRLCLEITESAIVADVGQAVRRLHTLRSFGIFISLDDFGTGWSSLGQLHRLPVDRIKVDRSFVAGLTGRREDGVNGAGGVSGAGADAAAEAVVRAIVALGHGLGLVVTAEGVETPEQLDRLRELGCDGVQGFLVGRPRPLADIDLEAAPR